jgi:hypothetical protein
MAHGVEKMQTLLCHSALGNAPLHSAGVEGKQHTSLDTIQSTRQTKNCCTLSTAILRDVPVVRRKTPQDAGSMLTFPLDRAPVGLYKTPLVSRG